MDLNSCTENNLIDMKCSLCHQHGHRSNNKKYHPKKLANKEEQPKIEELETLKSVFENKKAQQGLIALYSQSQTECTRNGKCGMEVGMSREKDQGAVLKLFLGDEITLDIDNSLPEDYILGKAKISAKHSSASIGSAVKVKWTSADLSAKEAIESIIRSEEHPHLLLTYLDLSLKKITIICIDANHIKKVITDLKEDAFTIPKGNSRGIEYSKKAMSTFLAQSYFQVDIEDANLKGGMDPIERRIQMLKSFDLGPD